MKLVAHLLPYLLTASLFILSSCGEPQPAVPGNAEHGHLPVVWLDQPKVPTTISKAKSKVLLVSGWAVAEKGISSVSIFLDGVFAMNAQTRLVRPDLAKLFPKFQDSGNAGWWANLNVQNFSAGPHEIVVQIKANDGMVKDIVDPITVEP